jgi:hypothetical protein
MSKLNLLQSTSKTRDNFAGTQSRIGDFGVSIIGPDDILETEAATL